MSRRCLSLDLLHSLISTIMYWTRARLTSFLQANLVVSRLQDDAGFEMELFSAFIVSTACCQRPFLNFIAFHGPLQI